MKILGLNAFHGDASAALLRDGQLVAALEEERLNRIKHWAGLPVACGEGMSRRCTTRPYRDFARSQGSSDGQTVAGGVAATSLAEPQLPVPRTVCASRR